MSFKPNISFSESEDISDTSPNNLTPIININSEYASPREQPEGLYLFPISILKEMESALPPDQARKFLTDQADMLDNMVKSLKTPKASKVKVLTFDSNKEEDDLDRLRGSVSKRVNELEKEQREDFLSSSSKKIEVIEKNFDIELLTQELEAVKNREQSTYILLKKAYHQIHMIEFQLLETQRNHFAELEKMNSENSELKRSLEAAQFKITCLLQENQMLKLQVSNSKTQLDKFQSSLHHSQEYPQESIGTKKNPYLTHNKTPSCDQYTPRSNMHTKNFQLTSEIIQKSDYKQNHLKYSEEKKMRNKSNNMSQILSWSPEPKSSRSNTQDALEDRLSSLISEHESIKLQLARVSAIKGVQSISKKKELEIELAICENNINLVNSKLRKIQSLSRS